MKECNQSWVTFKELTPVPNTDIWGGLCDGDPAHQRKYKKKWLKNSGKAALYTRIIGP